MSEHPVPEIHPKMDIVDILYLLLKQSRQQTHYKELIRQALELKGQSVEGDMFLRQAAAVLTQMNLDVRFFHHGKGIWGLKEWSPKQKTPRVPLLTPLNKREREPINDMDDGEEEELEKNFIIDDFDFSDSTEEDYDD